MGGWVISALHGGAITSDATLEDGREVSSFEVADRVIKTGADTLGISLEEMTPELAEALFKADIIVAKGQANYYVLTEYLEQNKANVVFLLSTKCGAVAEKFNLSGKVNIVQVVEKNFS